jgi:hypothetical protein
MYEFFRDEEDMTPEDIDYGNGVSQDDNQAWKNKRRQCANTMWVDRGTTRL